MKNIFILFLIGIAIFFAGCNGDATAKDEKKTGVEGTVQEVKTEKASNADLSKVANEAEKVSDEEAAEKLNAAADNALEDLEKELEE